MGKNIKIGDRVRFVSIQEQRGEEIQIEDRFGTVERINPHGVKGPIYTIRFDDRIVPHAASHLASYTESFLEPVEPVFLVLTDRESDTTSLYGPFPTKTAAEAKMRQALTEFLGLDGHEVPVPEPDSREFGDWLFDFCTSVSIVSPMELS